MWDNAPLLRSIANALFACSVLATLYGAVHYAVHMPKLLPIKSVRLSAAPEHVAAAAVLESVRHEVRGNFFTVDIDSLRQTLEKLPWVRRVSIRREFPNRLAVQLEEYKAIAHWNDEALINSQGVVFVAETTQKLPRFIGTDGSSAEVAQRYAKFSEQLAPLHLQVTQLSLSPRHAWQLHLSNDMVVELGREAMDERLARFVAVQKTDAWRNTEGVKYVDMRYRNGFAVRQEDRKRRTEG